MPTPARCDPLSWPPERVARFLAFIPDWGTNHYSLQKDTLSISGPWTYHGEKLTFTVRLARVK